MAFSAYLLASSLRESAAAISTSLTVGTDLDRTCWKSPDKGASSFMILRWPSSIAAIALELEEGLNESSAGLGGLEEGLKG